MLRRTSTRGVVFLAASSVPSHTATSYCSWVTRPFASKSSHKKNRNGKGPKRFPRISECKSPEAVYALLEHNQPAPDDRCYCLSRIANTVKRHEVRSIRGDVRLSGLLDDTRRDLDKCSAKGLATCISALAKMQYSEPAVLLQIAQACCTKADTFDAQGLANTA